MTLRNLPLVTLTTDFGQKDPFVGVMKGVILGICPEARIVDLVHEVEPQDIARAGRILADAHRFFPAGTVHVAVVDPGVGTSRRALAVKAGGHGFVGPDNGIFTEVIRASGEERRIHALENPRYFLSKVSRTFHGRDVFAPVAAWMAAGTPLEAFGPPLSDPILLEHEGSRLVSGEGIIGRIIGFDRFGNAETNITAKDLQEAFGGNVPVALYLLECDERLSIVQSYSEAEAGKGAALLNSSGRLEVFICRGSAREKMGLELGDQVKAERIRAGS